MKKWIFIGVGAVLLIAISVGASLFLMGSMNKDAAAAADAPPPEPVNPFLDTQYMKLEPAFIVNLPQKKRPNLIQLEVNVATKDTEALAALKQHMPVIRNNLLMLYGKQNSDDIQTSEGKEKLRVETLETIQAIMQERYGKEGIDDAFFTSFVMQ